MHNKKLIVNDIAIAFDSIESVSRRCDKSCIVTGKSGYEHIVNMDFDSINRLWDQYLSNSYTYTCDEFGNILDHHE